jgi:hypothetical protein
MNGVVACGCPDRGETKLIAHNRSERRRHASAVGRVYIRTSFEKFPNNRKGTPGACPH